MQFKFKNKFWLFVILADLADVLKYILHITVHKIIVPSYILIRRRNTANFLISINFKNKKK